MNITVENGPYFDVWGEALPCLSSMWWIFFLSTSKAILPFDWLLNVQLYGLKVKGSSGVKRCKKLKKSPCHVTSIVMDTGSEGDGEANVGRDRDGLCHPRLMKWVDDMWRWPQMS